MNIPAITLREGRVEDARELSALFHASVREIAGQYYSAEQVQAWSPAAPDPVGLERRLTDGRTVIVATGSDRSILGYGDIELDGHIDHLYCRPDAAGTGVAALIYERLEATARGAGIGHLFVEASEPASRFFRRQGFRIVDRIDFELSGVAIHNYRMEKQLD